MAFQLDHIIIAVHDLDTAMMDFRALGFTVLYGGRHASGTTHNALICFQDGSYLELLALTGDSRSDPHTADFSGLAQGAEGIAGYALLAETLEILIPDLRGRGAAVGDVVPGRRLRADGAEMRWLTARVAGEMSPFLIEDQTPRTVRVPNTPEATQHANGIAGIVELEVLIAHLDEMTIASYTKLLGISPWRRSAASATFVLQGVKLRLTPAVTPAAQVYLAKSKTSLYRLVLLGSAPQQLDPTLTHGALMQIVTEFP